MRKIGYVLREYVKRTCHRCRKSVTKMDGPAAYMTIEASFIVPFVFMLFMLIIYFAFFLYNHTVVYQACYLAALRGTQIKNVTDDVVTQYVDREAGELLANQIFQYQTEHSVDVGMLSIEVKAYSYIDNLLSKLGVYNVTKLESDRSAKAIRIDPATFIRNAHRLEDK